MAYSSKVVESINNLTNGIDKNSAVGSLDKNDPSVGTGLVGAPACGDVMKLQIKVGDDGKIVDAKFKTFGCGSAIASSEYAVTMIKGVNLDEAFKISNEQIASHLSLPPVKRHCSLLAEDAIKAAIQDYKSKQGLKKIHQQPSSQVAVHNETN
jgi:Fe-S cluster assembly scaffold IscU